MKHMIAIDDTAVGILHSKLEDMLGWGTPLGAEAWMSAHQVDSMAKVMRQLEEIKQKQEETK